MPPVSQAQRGAMRAAAAGNSTIGIPRSVGAEFSAADQGGKLPKHKGKKGKKKFVLKKKAKKPPMAPRRPMPMADDDAGADY